MKKVLIIAITKDYIEKEAWESWLNQDYDNYSILLNVMKLDKLHEDEKFNKPMNVAVNREEARKLALNSDADYFLFVDSDIVLPKNAISELVKQLEAPKPPDGIYFKKHAIAGYYLLRNSSDVFCMAKLVEDDGIIYLRFPEKSVIKVDYAGLGCILTSRELLEKIKIKTEFNKELKIAGTENYVTFDDSWNFCNQVFELGYQLYADGDVVCKHLTEGEK